MGLKSKQRQETEAERLKREENERVKKMVEERTKEVEKKKKEEQKILKKQYMIAAFDFKQLAEKLDNNLGLDIPTTRLIYEASPFLGAQNPSKKSEQWMIHIKPSGPKIDGDAPDLAIDYAYFVFNCRAPIELTNPEYMELQGKIIASAEYHMKKDLSDLKKETPKDIPATGSNVWQYPNYLSLRFGIPLYLFYFLAGSFVLFLSASGYRIWKWVM